MGTDTGAPSAGSTAARFPILLLLLFAGSGCAALIYEIVWFQLLQLAIGSTTLSTGVLLAAYMGGLCLGSLGLGRLVRPGHHPLRVYAVLEAGIGLFGVIALFEIPAIQRVYFAGAEHGLPNMLLRGAIAAFCLLPPTVLMGASLPALVRWVESTPRGVAWWGLLYGGNTAGAVFGCLLTGFWLLRIYDTHMATYAAAGLNAAVAAASFALAARTTKQINDHVQVRRRGAWPVYVTIGLSGACALGAEVIWTRLLGMMLGSTVYVFSIILAVFLIGLALGSGGASWLLRSRPGPVFARKTLGWSQILAAAGIAWTAYLIAAWLPFLPNGTLLTGTPWETFRVDISRCLLALLPPTLLWGASFPLACAAAVAEKKEDSGHVVGGIYAANTLGAIVGALGVSLALRSNRLAVGLTGSLAAACLLMLSIHPIPGTVIAYGRRSAIAGGTVIYTKEG